MQSVTLDCQELLVEVVAVNTYTGIVLRIQVVYLVYRTSNLCLLEKSLRLEAYSILVLLKSVEWKDM